MFKLIKMYNETTTLFFKNDYEILNLLKGDDKVFHSVINIGESFKLKYQDLLKNDNKLYFEYKNVNSINEFKIDSEEVIIKTTQNLFIYFKSISGETKVKIFYKPENTNDLNLFIMGLKKIAKNNENK